MRGHLAVAALYGIAIAGCGRAAAPTEIVVEIASDLAIPDQIDGMRLQVFVGNDTRFDNTYALGSGPGAFILPRRVALVAAGGDAPTFTIQVDGLFRGRVVVTRRATVAFIPHDSLFLQIDLQQACALDRSRACDPGMTCVAGSCVPETIDSTDLVHFTAAIDASLVPDATAVDTLAAPDAAPATPDAPVMLGTGTRCGSTAECASGFCTDGVCCESACGDLCRSCNLNGQAGHCVAIPSGQDPDNECPDDGAATCRRDGFCDGVGACRLYAAGATCVPGTCAGSTRTTASTCDGRGSCIAGGTRSCVPYQCSATNDCLSRCTTDTDCVTPHVCVSGVCSKKPSGQPCTSDSECGSGSCAQGVCCATRCAGLCRSCALPGSLGICGNVPAGQDPFSQCPDDGAATCGRDGYCDGAGACRLHAKGTVCAPPACTGSVSTEARTCDGAGACRGATTASCAPYLCGNGACRTSCASSSDCVPPNLCVGGACVPPAENCTNNIDDDGNGLVDCADPACAAFMCVVPAPPGWNGPVAFYDGPAAMVPSCGAPFSIQAFQGNRDLTCAPAECSACACMASPDLACGAPRVTWFSGADCSGTSSDATGGACQTLDAAMPPSSVQVTKGAVTAGSCMPSGGDPSRPPASWAAAASACRPPTFGGGCGVQVCAPRPQAPFEGKLCVLAAGDLPCPAQYPSRRVYFAGVNDTRACTACTCNPADVVCGGKLRVSSDATCAAAEQNVPASGSCSNLTVMPQSYDFAADSPACGAGTGGTPSGSCDPAMPTTVCCQP